jgi:hypothetical protein
MNATFRDDELNTALTLLVNRIADEAGLSAKDRATLKRWRSSEMKLGSDDMDEFVRKANEDFTRGVARREKSAIQKHDWND